MLTLPRSEAVVPLLRVVPSTGSTNADLVAMVRDDDDLPSFTVLVTGDQTAGRGRLDRAWTAPPGASLAVSVLVRASRLPGESLGWLPLAAGVAMAEAVRGAVPSTAEVAVKWPNDVLIGGRKASGVLAEIVPGVGTSVIVGAGLNVRMRAEDLPVPTATSLAVEGGDTDEDSVLAAYLTELRARVSALEGADGDAEASGLRAAVLAASSTPGRAVRVSLPDGSELVGLAETIDAGGRLVVVAGGRRHAVAAGDVVHVRAQA